MIVASHNAQGWSRAGAGEAPGCGMGVRPATVAVHQLQRHARCEKPRVHCRGSGTPRTFFSIARRITAHRRLGFSSSRLSRHPQFMPVSIDPDELHELRNAERSGRQPVLARAQALPDHLIASTAVGPEHIHFVERLSCVALDDEQHEPKGVGSAQESVGVFQYVGC